MKPLSKIIFSCFILLIVCSNSFCQYFTIKGKQFYDGNDDPFYPVIMNYSPRLTYNTYPPSVPAELDFHPHSNYGSTIGFENPNGPLAVLYDFREIDSLGFNTVRIGAGLNRYNAARDSTPCDSIISGPLFTIDWFLDMNGDHNECFAIQPPYSSDSSVNLNMFLYLQKLNDLIALADSAGLKVILLTADGYGLFQDQAAVDDYEAFLEVLTDYFKTNTTIMAYDLDNEPNVKDGGAGIYFRPKSEVCNYTRQLYDAIKYGSDPNHLITIGGSDIFNWDPEVMKTDFVCFHIYPWPDFLVDFAINNSQADVVEHGINRMLGQIYWATNHVQRPWILEETGFTSRSTNADWLCFGMHGDYTGLSNHLSSFLPYAKNCVSGFAWWGFQDDFMGTPPPAIPCDPNLKSSDSWRQRFWGLIQTGDPDSTTGSYTSPVMLRKQPACSTFTAFDWNTTPSACTMPPDYYDPNQNATVHNTSLYHSVSGYVKDDNQQPIENAVVWGVNYVKTILGAPDVYVHNWIYTYTDSSGNFELVPYTPLYDLPTDISIACIRGAASSSKWFEEGQPPWQWETGNFQMTDSVGDIYIEKKHFDYDETVNNVTVASGNTRNFRGWNSITVNNTNIYGTSNIRARQEININHEFHADTSSEVHIFTDETFHNCDNFSSFTRLAAPNGQGSSEAGLTGAIELTFKERKDKPFNVSIIPNPNKGIFTVDLGSNTFSTPVAIEIKNPVGESLKKITTLDNNFTIDLSAASKGIYFIQVKSQYGSATKKIIIN
ncbi:MAG TPA: T9SS type A sorting domain-containing protein [Bacteroidia bacterium]|nr:T9SS type A sorting domain-containing protein [Bacteroidia bacterium]